MLSFIKGNEKILPILLSCYVKWTGDLVKLAPGAAMYLLATVPLKHRVLIKTETVSLSQ